MIVENGESHPWKINSWLSRCSTARGSSTRLSPAGPTKVKAGKYFLLIVSIIHRYCRYSVGIT